MGGPAGDVAEAKPQHYAVTPGQEAHDGHNSKEDGQQNGHQQVHGEAEEFLHLTYARRLPVLRVAAPPKPSSIT